MFLQEEFFLLPILQSTFVEEDRVAVGQKSKAFGFATHEPDVRFWNGEKEKQTDYNDTEHLQQ